MGYFTYNIFIKLIILFSILDKEINDLLYIIN